MSIPDEKFGYFADYSYIVLTIHIKRMKPEFYGGVFLNPRFSVDKYLFFYRVTPEFGAVRRHRVPDFYSLKNQTV